MFLVDSHCHLDLLDTQNDNNSLQQIMQRASQMDVRYFLNVCVSLKSFPQLLKTSESFSNVAASVGLHPNEQDESVNVDQLVQLAKHPKVIAMGETGLDYFRSTGDLNWQRERFRMHIAAAKITKKPLIVHTREASCDTMTILREENASDVRGVMHCFTEDWDVAKKALELGFLISFSGIVTFKSAQQIQDVAKKLPLDKMLLETDSPYLAPDPHRGKPNEPGFVRHTAEYLAQLKNVDLDELAHQTSKNFFNLFEGAVRPHV